RVALARAQLQAARALDPSAPEVLFAEGDYLYHLEEDFAGALAAYERTLAAQAGHPEAQTMIGLAQRRLGRFAQSARTLMQAHDADPGNLGTASVLVETLALMNQTRTLQQLLPRLRARFPDQTDFGAQAALLALSADGDVERAQRTLDDVTPNDGEAYYEAALTLAWAKRDLDAIKAFWRLPPIRQLIRDNTTYQGARQLSLGTAHMLLGDRAEGEQLLEDIAARLRTPQSDESEYSRYARLVSLAQAQVWLGQTEAARDNAQTVISEFPMSRDRIAAMSLHTQANLVLGRAGDRDALLEFVERCLDQPNGLSAQLLKLDPHWDFLLDDPRYVAMLDEALSPQRN
ncbi:MAG: hypothetical protein AAFR44_14130, partial [Pseudomonadota bacterium]